MGRDLAVISSKELRETEIPSFIASPGHPAATPFRDFFFGQIGNANTQRAYCRAVEQFLTWIAAQGLALVEIRPADVGAYLRQHPGATSIKKQHRSVIKQFLDLLVERHVCLINPPASVKTEKLRVNQGSTPEIAKGEIRAVLETLQGNSLSQVRDRAAIGILVYTACRKGAISNLRRSDFHGRPGQRALRFQEKGSNNQSAEVRHDLEAWVNEYIRQAGLGEANPASPLFRPLVRREERLQNRQVEANGVGRMVKRKLRQAGIRTELSAHSLRVATITDLISQGVDIASVQELAGHADARTTKLYDRTSRRATRNLVERISF
ncbi:tyrosine-type recombinase/integrase [Allorhodopirellula solitaria]|uniref:Tyrosine recombinase XerD n=1 Tax=Allorhodopirellula solitaria TaxID=2527987 RepID=A0A5C5XXP1_9BACT|nr:tyrosine-type recombinase/integrase [Allorhodopirellula solitaria]TWT66655.1 Tyrosine recombinase XerD [Allorhodopirellula solitaria]